MQKIELNKFLAVVKTALKVSKISILIFCLEPTKTRNRSAGSGGKYNRDRVKSSN
jgi:hypothetical protein